MLRKDKIEAYELLELAMKHSLDWLYDLMLDAFKKLREEERARGYGFFCDAERIENWLKGLQEDKWRVWNHGKYHKIEDAPIEGMKELYSDSYVKFIYLVKRLVLKGEFKEKKKEAKRRDVCA